MNERSPDRVRHNHGQTGTIAAWDLPTRLFHWLLVILVASSWATFEYSESLGDNLLKWHRWSGLIILTLLVWRLLWGVMGSPTSRFINFAPSPKTLATYTSALLRGGERKYLGHNPLGSMMILALLALLFTQAGLGLFTVEHNDLTAGPLYLMLSEEGRKTASQWHGFLFNTLIFWLIAIHIVANALYALVRGEPLIKAMFTGRKPNGEYADGNISLSRGEPMLRAALLLVVSAVIVFGGIWTIGGKFLAMRLW